MPSHPSSLPGPLAVVLAVLLLAHSLLLPLVFLVSLSALLLPSSIWSPLSPLDGRMQGIPACVIL